MKNILSMSGGISMEETNYSPKYESQAFIIIKDFLITYISNFMIEVTGYNSGEIIGKTIYDFFKILLIDINDDIESIKEKRECIIFTKSMDFKEVHISVYKSSNEQEYAVIFDEILDYNNNDNLQLFNQLLLGNYFGVGLFSIPGSILVKANETFLSYLESPNNSLKNILGKPIEKIIPGWSGSEAEKDWKDIIKNNKTYHWEEYQYDGFSKGTTYWKRTFIPISVNNKVKFFIQIISDLTEEVVNKKLLEEQTCLIKQQRDILETVVDNIPDSLIVIGKNRELIKLNKETKNFLSKNKLLFNMHELHENLRIYDKNNKVITDKCLPSNRALNGEKVINEKVQIEIEDKIFDFRISATPLYNTSGMVDMIVLYCKNITNEVEYSKKLENLLKMQRELFAFISHEFKTPLTVINAAIQAIQVLCKGDLSEKGVEYIKKIQRSSLQQLRLVNNLLDITKADSGYLKIHKKNFDMVLMTKEIIDSVYMYAKAKGVEIKFTSNSKKIINAVDDEKYERILLNLLSNAIKFTPPGRNIYVNIYKNNNKLYLKVKDEGIGIPKEKQNLIFQYFVQIDDGLIRNSEGTGIGLCLAKLLANAMGGELNFKSDIDDGSTFIMTLPMEIIEKSTETKFSEESNNRLLQATNIEFSNIYFD